jgi:hypothetical protein
MTLSVEISVPNSNLSHRDVLTFATAFHGHGRRNANALHWARRIFKAFANKNTKGDPLASALL